jgi:hypothetical protein
MMMMIVMRPCCLSVWLCLRPPNMYLALLPRTAPPSRR